ncbi:hypothetical protein OAO01_04300 [Oligoflexia bacterium]|nr:hypothetical protein [Oligoflexia bacterium]
MITLNWLRQYLSLSTIVNSYTTVQKKIVPGLLKSAGVATELRVHWFSRLLAKGLLMFQVVDSNFSQLQVPRGFEPPGFPSPIGDYKAFAGCSGADHFPLEAYGGTVFHDGGPRRWVHFEDPRTYLTRPLRDAICLIEKAIVGSNIDYKEVNASYPDTWGAQATYIDMAPRFFGGLHGMIRMLPAIPPSQHGTATCVLLRGLFAPIGDSFYAIDWRDGEDGFDPELFTGDLECGNFQDHETLIRAFNDLAHARGLKTGFAMVTNSDQLHLHGRAVDWRSDYDQNFFMDRCAHALSLGFDAIHFDSIKHAGGYDHSGQYHIYDAQNYHGVGLPIPFEVMQMTTHLLRHWSGRNDLSFVGEFADQEPRYREMGLNAGIAYDAGGCDEHSVAQLCNEQAGSRRYKAGLDVSDDNDDGRHSQAQRLASAQRALLSQTANKIPVLLTQADLFPLINTSYHKVVLQPIHWYDHGGHFHPDCGRFRWALNEVFAAAARKRGYTPL